MSKIPLTGCSFISEDLLRRVAERGLDGSHGAGDALRQSAAFIEERSHAPIGGTEAGETAIPSRFHMQRRVCDAGGSTHLPGRLVLSEKKTTSRDAEAHDAFNGLGATHDFFAQVLQRDSLDNAGMPLDATVHYGHGFTNALWDGRRIIFGDGDGKIFRRFTVLEVEGHEAMHGATQFIARLGYSGQTGALNEHISDAFGMMIKQYRLGLSASESDWIIGAGVFGPGVRGQGVRSMKAPGTAYDDPILGKDPQPDHMDRYVETSRDNGGVHLNSGIPNRAFYESARAIGGNTSEVLAPVWYEALQIVLSDCDFAGFARATVDVAGQLYGTESSTQEAIIFGWKEVGLAPRLPGRSVSVPAAIPNPAVLPGPSSPPRPATFPAGAARREKWSSSLRK